MAMYRVENELRRTGNPQDLDIADRLAARIKDKGDFILPALMREVPVVTSRFKDEQREFLKKEGYVFYDLTGQSMSSLKAVGREIYSDKPFEHISSMRSEVAINPSKLFLPKSNGKNLKKQEEMVYKFSQELGKKVKGVKAIIGQVPDYTELAFKYFDATGDRLFGHDSPLKYWATTKTSINGDLFAVVGFSAPHLGGPEFAVGSWESRHGFDIGAVAPLVVPVGK